MTNFLDITINERVFVVWLNPVAWWRSRRAEARRKAFDLVVDGLTAEQKQEAVRKFSGIAGLPYGIGGLIIPPRLIYETYVTHCRKKGLPL